MRTLAFASAALLAAAVVCAQPADYPNPGKPITILVPFATGGITDQLARGIGQKMAESMKATVIVENKPGGIAQPAASALKAAPADGYTLLVGDIGALALNPSLYNKLSYDPTKDFVPLARLAITPGLLVVPPSSPYRSMADLVAAAKTKTGGLNMASQGTGSGGHLFVEMLREQTKGQFTHIAYRGSAPALGDLMGGHVDTMLDSIGTSGPLVKDGKLRALAIGTAERSPQFPGVPTLQELGYGPINMVGWFGVVAKAGTPPALVSRLSAEIVKAISAPDLVKRISDQGLEVAPQPAAEFKGYMETEIARWNKIIKTAGIQLE